MTPAVVGDELLEQYVAEYCGHIATIRRGLLAVATDGMEVDQQLLREVLPAVHSIRGAGFLGLAKISELARQMEDVVALLGSRKVVPTPYRLRVLLFGTDRLLEMLENAGTSNQADIEGIMAALSKLGATSAAALSASSDPILRSDKKVHMLVVDDDFSSRLLLKTFLSRYGECVVADKGAEAVDEFRSALGSGKTYDLVCTDIMMPEMDGHEVVRQMRTLEEDHGISSILGARIVMMTALDDISDVIRSFEEFSDAYFLKPINLANLLRHLRSWRLIP